eukprot:TRINITY_DN2126_c1_g1_i4.p1 TRINITY_DN2126_c1_g1~~TRINITY_DN2126_c1_g1_i4.p1  ORF type:complete len:175 (-),score=22.59 TRINITY_DN2126_c1_g1_i4:14-538(-)
MMIADEIKKSVKTHHSMATEELRQSYRKHALEFLDYTIYDEDQIHHQMRLLSTTASNFYTDVKPSSSDIQAREQFRKDLESRLQKYLSNCYPNQRTALNLMMVGPNLHRTYFPDDEIDLVMIRRHWLGATSQQVVGSISDCIKNETGMMFHSFHHHLIPSNELFNAREIISLST